MNTHRAELTKFNNPRISRKTVHLCNPLPFAALNQLDSTHGFDYDLYGARGRDRTMPKETPRPAPLCRVASRTSTRAVLITLFYFGLPLLAWAESSFDVQSQPVTLVELYTSQGCSSCPPADAFLQDLSDRGDVLALSFHVDYWDSDDWSDPFSDPSFSVRQKAYQDVLGFDYIYTPQIVVGGKFAAPGGQRDAILNAISMTNERADDIPPEIILQRKSADRILIDVVSVSVPESAGLYVAVFRSSQTTRVKGGENRGRTLRNVNVVKRLVQLSSNLTGDMVFDVALSDIGAHPSDGLAVFIQSAEMGKVQTAVTLPPRPAARSQFSQNDRPDVNTR